MTSLTAVLSLALQLLPLSYTSGTKVDLQGLGTMVKYGSEALFAYVPRKMAELASKTGRTTESMPVKAIVLPKVAAELRAMLHETYQQLCGDLVVAHQSFRTKEAKMEKDKLIHGTITETKQQEFDNAKKLYEKLFSIVSTLAECISQEMPALEVCMLGVPTIFLRYIVPTTGVSLSKILTYTAIANQCIHIMFADTNQTTESLHRSRRRRRTAPAG